MHIKKKYLKESLKRNKVIYILLVMGVMVQPFCSVLVTRFVRDVVDGIGRFDEETIINLMVVCGLTVATYMLSWMCRYLSSVLIYRLSLRMKGDILRRLKGISFDIFEGMKVGNLNALISDDVEEASIIIRLYSNGFVMPIIESVVVLSYMMILNWKLALFSVFGMFLMNLASKQMVPVISKESYRVKTERGRFHGIILKIFGGVDIIKIFSCGEFIKKKYKEARESIFKSRMRMQRASVLQGVSLGTIGFLFTNGAILIIAYRVIRTGSTMGIMVTYIMLMEKVMTSSRTAFAQLGKFGKCDGAWKRINKIMEHDFKVEVEEVSEDMGELKSISLNRVSFNRGEIRVLEDVNMNLKRGQIYCIKGESGCGKSTLMKIIAGFYSCSDGELSWSGTSIDERLYGVAYVPSLPKLFNISIYDNLTIGNKDITREEVYDICRKLQVHDWIMGLKDGYDTKLRSNGGNVSGGQKQILAIIRGILMRRSILLMDEPFSNLDDGVERALKIYLQDIKENTIILYSSHRESTFQYCDELMLLN